MNDQFDKVSALITRLLEGEQLTSGETQILNEWLNVSPENRQLFTQLNDPHYVQHELEKMYNYDAEAGWQKIQHSTITQLNKIDIKQPLRWKYWIAAAIILFAIAGGAVFFFYFPSKTPALTNTSPANSPTDIAAPIVSKATITLQDGKLISIDSMNAAKMALDGVSVQKTPDGQILYTGDSTAVATNYFNVLTNPRGSRVVQLTLSDGTKIWLNAESKIRYPVSFTGTTREVEMEGEVYFEVAKNAAKPFVVQSNGTSVLVTGTHFNINAYNNEPVLNVTLLEGGVKVSKLNNVLSLKPGEQAQVGTNTINVDKQVDIEKVMAWKNGMFSFDGTNIYTAMRELSRWYDVEVHFKDSITENFYGDIPRNSNISGVLNMLQTTGSVHFKTTGNMIEVYK
ncbi:MAG: FecR domain-containing protein [Agriterribacter sp.]